MIQHDQKAVMTNLKIRFLRPDGETQTIETEAGVSLMEAALRNRVDGIPADCGGACSCATCHVYVEEGWSSKLSAMSSEEQAMLECVDEPRPTSRLSCQIILDETLDGLEVTIPEA